MSRDLELMQDILYLSRADIEALDFRMKEIIAAVEEAFKERGTGNAEMPPKPGIHPLQDAFIHAMPAYLPGVSAAGIKWVSGYPENFKLGLPYISGLIILNDPNTGLPISVMDATWITAKRTGAATGLAAKYLARPDSKILGIIGCGVQGRSNLEALDAVMNLDEVRAYDTSPANLHRYVNDMTAEFDINVKPVNNPRGAVEGSDIIVTAGRIQKHPNPIIEKSWVKTGVFACPIDFDSCWKPETMLMMDKFYTDDAHQLEYYRSTGYFQSIPSLYAELAELVVGHKAGRESADERIMSMNLGVAIEDMAVAVQIYEEARRKAIGKRLPL
jgi:ornithine cyclodeaminase/alanine dehydrogenase-like protein (mu-crystallin family)